MGSGLKVERKRFAAGHVATSATHLATVSPARVQVAPMFARQTEWRRGHGGFYVPF